MKITGLITEYNPFHNGHLYHLSAAKEVTSSEGTVAVMSGDFTQRGAPAITDKYTRAAMALEAGVDAVLELPVRYACGSAGRFAGGAVGLIEALGCVDTIVYGCEGSKAATGRSDASGGADGSRAFRGKTLTDDEYGIIRRIAALFETEPDDFRELFQKGLREGLGYPAARAAAAKGLIPGAEDILSGPNNILAIEYEKALIAGGGRVRGVALRRNDSGYFESGSQIRRAIDELGGGDALLNLMPASSAKRLDQRIETDDFSEILAYRLISLGREDLSRYEDVSQELASRIFRLRGRCFGFEEAVEELSARNIPAARARRALLHILLGMENAHGSAYGLPFIRVLGFRRDSSVMKELKAHSALPLVTKLADAPEEAWEEDHRASLIYNQIVFDKYGSRLPDDYHAAPVII